MNRHKTLAMSAVSLCFGILLSSDHAIAQSVKDFVGSWMLVSAITEQGGKKSDTFGPDTRGYLVFDASGRYVITFIGAGLPKFASNNRATGTAIENKAVVAGSLSHFGTYVVNEADKSFTFRIERATFPNWNNSEQKRPFVITGDELRYTAAAASAGGTATVTWRRAK